MPAALRLSLLSLAFGNFVIGCGALAFIGLLDTVARDLALSPAAAGQIAGLFSFGVCVSGAVLGALTGLARASVDRPADLRCRALGFGGGRAAHATPR